MSCLNKDLPHLKFGSSKTSAKLMDVLQLILSNYCILKNYTALHWWSVEPWLVTYLNLSQLLFYVTIHCLRSNESIKVAVMISSCVEKTFIFSTHSAVTCSKDCPWDTHVTCIESQTDTQMHITRSHTLQTASLSKINDAWHCGPEK